MTAEDDEECIDCYRIWMGEVITKNGRCEKCGKCATTLQNSIQQDEKGRNQRN